MKISALDIVDKAIELGFDKCGIIPIEMMRGYEIMLEKRMEHFPQTRDKYEPFRSFAHLQNHRDIKLFFQIIIGCELLYSQNFGIFLKEKNGGIKQMR